MMVYIKKVFLSDFPTVCRYSVPKQRVSLLPIDGSEMCSIKTLGHNTHSLRVHVQ